MDLKYIQAIDDGTSDWQSVRDNFDIIESSLSKKITTTINYAVEIDGITTVLNADKHLEINITNAYVQLGDNVNKEIIMELEGISDSIRFSPTEKSGKIKIFKILSSVLLVSEDLKIKTSSDRKILLGITGESNE